ncbi:class II glutamine amidotransferase [Pelagibius sp. Alg239-R121]|uniref:class II glutamine amidotransferase n=1 Tax=Pelagibius sp. Alg239-R121 TaxID=2993448 RepID=UPI0024A72807|nr:class II glutamine amidotransferase [Pelagibius sp. Alg239-R121]
MCRWLAYSGSPIFPEDLIFEPDNSLAAQSLHSCKAKVAVNGDGFGIGWYGEREIPGVYREVLPAWSDCNLRSLAANIRTHHFFAHIRASTGTATSRPNCHPFTHGKWLFMHNGQIGDYDRHRRRLEALIPDDLYACRQGSTDSELIFYLLFHFGLEDDPLKALRATLKEVARTSEHGGKGKAFRCTAALTDGQTTYAIRFSTDNHPPSLYWQETSGHTLIVSEPLDTALGEWQPVPPSTILVTEGGNRISTEAL